MAKRPRVEAIQYVNEERRGFHWFSTGFYHPLYELEGSTQWLMKMQPESQNIHNFKQQVAELWAKAVKSGVEPTRNAPSYKYLFRPPPPGESSIYLDDSNV